MATLKVHSRAGGSSLECNVKMKWSPGFIQLQTMPCDNSYGGSRAGGPGEELDERGSWGAI